MSWANKELRLMLRVMLALMVYFTVALQFRSKIGIHILNKNKVGQQTMLPLRPPIQAIRKIMVVVFCVKNQSM